MLNSLSDVQFRLGAEGLFTSVYHSGSLLIGGRVVEGDNGLRVLQEACAINRRGQEWVLVFPSLGLSHFEMPGSLPDLMAVVLNAYRHCRETGNPFNEAVKAVVKDADQFLIGRALAGV